MTILQHVPVGPIDPHRFEAVLTGDEYRQLLNLIDRAATALDGRVIWNVNSTAKGGGVVELLRPLLGYSRGGGVDARWVVIAGGREFFEITKRLHNHLHGMDGHGGVDAGERAEYERTLTANAAELVRLVGPRDIVIAHDPQTAGLIDPLRQTGATVIWRCHIGIDHANDTARGAWDFLLRYVTHADACVFSRAEYVWDGLDAVITTVIQPSIDVFSPKNADQAPARRQAILAAAGIVPGGNAHAPTFTRFDGTPGRVDRRAELHEVAPLAPTDRVVAQISRWDRLKDPVGVLRGFAEHVAPASDAHLLLAGPATDSVADDPEGAEVFAAVVESWRALEEDTRARVHLASLPMADLEENAAIVNAIQRHATVVVQKSLAEGFGLTVSEAMWKERPVVASRVGGIQDQIIDGASGALVDDPHDLRAYGEAVAGLLADPTRAQAIGAAAKERVREHFLGPHHLARYFELIEQVLAARVGTTA